MTTRPSLDYGKLDSTVIIDFHTHIVPPAIKERRSDYLDRDPVFRLLYSQPKARLATAEELIESMDRAGVDVSVALNMGWVSHELCRETNDYILEAAARFPRRLVAFCSVNPQAGDRAVAEVERCARAGALGIGELRPDMQGFAAGDEPFQNLAAQARRSRLILLFHASEPVGHTYAGKGEVTPQVLYAFIQACHGLPFVCAHWGGGLPFYALMPEVAEALKDVYFDTAASPFLYQANIYRHAVDMVGAEKILFGSDNPLMPPSRPIREIRSLSLPAGAEELILGENARRLLGLEA